MYFCAMEHKELFIYNSFTRSKEKFTPIDPDRIGMYVCGPTVYSDVHLGNCRTFISFDIIYRYLMHLGYKVRYVRNITDVGHLENDVDTGGEDKVAKKARLEQLEPMEIVQRYTNGFHDVLKQFNTLNPSIEPTATGHIIEQIEMVQQILDNGFAYEKNGSVYFDTQKLNATSDIYGTLSGKVQDDLLTETRDDLKNQSEKNHPSDFAIWVKAEPKHIMKWESPWSLGFPGWHLECSAMSTKYLGKTFDIHGGGMDLQFPHHENEIAQNMGACNCAPVNYWMHANMLLMNGRKMSKSPDPITGLSNSISPEELFEGTSPHMSKPYSPMIVRFFMLQTHYHSTLDLSDKALLAAEKGYHRLMDANRVLTDLAYGGNDQSSEEDVEINKLLDQAYEDMSNDFNCPQALSRLFMVATKINAIKNGQLDFNLVSRTTWERMQTTFHNFIFEIFGLKDDSHGGGNGANGEVLDGLMKLLIDIRQDVRAKKDFETSDKIRDTLKELNVILKDGKDGTDWSIG